MTDDEFPLPRKVHFSAERTKLNLKDAKSLPIRSFILIVRVIMSLSHLDVSTANEVLFSLSKCFFVIRSNPSLPLFSRIRFHPLFADLQYIGLRTYLPVTDLFLYF